MPTENLLEFLLYIAPGFLAVELYNYYFPVKERNSFTQIAKSVICALVIISVVQYLDQNNFAYFLQSTSPGLTNTKYIIALFLGGIIAGFLAVFQLKVRSSLAENYQNLSWLAKEPDSIWQKINSPTNNDWAVVHLNDASIYLGWITEYQSDPNLNDQDFILNNAKRITEDFEEIYIVDGIGVYFNTKNVNKIEFFKGSNLELNI